ncbi:hypothetical protein [Paracoccus laeviglucosivorans]|uniref:DUF3887 domain-containing protein n=1 Tax=Paracoccus laeviglucosivorans TaxID=1197861 RepID=A0A521AR77_9RHOB|nr:hypothetical protein [Paracoccus laeviglucosivorans]SMO37150.1 hypothetical protein SAMN06265221_101274 [Paracoccus laeviglucosivorans]
MRGLWFGLSLLASPVFADAPCALNGTEPVAVHEAAKADFLAGRFEAFFQAATPLVQDRDAKFDEVMGPLARLIPDGFAECSTVMQRRDTGGLVQEVSLFKLKPPGSGHLSLLLTSAPVEGEQKIAFFRYNDQISQVLEAVR